MAVELNDLDFENYGTWPTSVKLVLAGVVFIAIVTLGYFLDTSSQIAKLEQFQKTEVKLKQAFKTRSQKAANLNAYKRQMVEMKDLFLDLLHQLPTKNQVSDLLDQISTVGLASGLEFVLIKPHPEQQKDFYVELPIQLAMTGDYHQFGKFVSELAALDRIVTLSDFTLIRPKTQKGVDDLASPIRMQVTAKTYRYKGGLDD